MIVVSNTSPITNLAAIHQFELLHLLYGQIHIFASIIKDIRDENFIHYLDKSRPLTYITSTQ